MNKSARYPVQLFGSGEHDRTEDEWNPETGLGFWSYLGQKDLVCNFTEYQNTEVLKSSIILFPLCATDLNSFQLAKCPWANETRWLAH